MSFMEVDFGIDPTAKLSARGIRIPTLRGLRKLHKDCRFEPPCFCQAAIDNATLLSIGAFTLINGGTISHVSFGRYCSVAPDVSIGFVEHPMHWLTTSDVGQYSGVHEWDTYCAPSNTADLRSIRRGYAKSRPITKIGHDVWLGQGVFIKAGISIGNGAVVGARSVVTKDVPPYSVVAGTPATIRKMRFSEGIIERLLALEWWNYSIFDFYNEKIDDIDSVVSRLEELTLSGRLTWYEPKPITTADLSSLLS